MGEIRASSHDFKVFFRRLVVPGELGRNLDAILSPSQAAGMSGSTLTEATQKQINAANTATTDAGFASALGSLLSSTFANYEPSDFKADMLAKARSVASDFRTTIVSKRSDLSNTQTLITQAQAALTTLSVPPGFVGPTMRAAIPAGAVTTLTQEAEFFNTSQNDPIAFAQAQADAAGAAATAAATTPTTAAAVATPAPIPTPSPAPVPPIVRDRAQFSLTKDVIASSVMTLPDLLAIENNYVSQINTELDTLLGSTVTPQVESGIRASLSANISFLLSLRAPSLQNRDQVKTLNNLISVLKQGAQSIQSEIDTLTAATPLRPFYEPILLDCLIGPQQVQTSGNRMGQPSNATVSFHLPLDSNGTTTDLFLGFKVEDIFAISTLEQGGKSIPARTLSILSSNMRETTILPFDMIQIWGRKKLATGSTFPGDYAPIFTGFVTKTGVNYSKSTVTVTVTSEDVGKALRLARINVDPSLDPRFRAAGINPIAYNNVLQSPTFKTGADLIKGLIVGSPGTILGLSQAEVIEQVQVKPQGGQTMPTFTTSAKVVKLAADFQNIKLNLFEDLLSRWPPYATQFKNAFRLWETDGRNKFDICREIADVTEYEFYVDNMGVVNYHPPLYFLNPFAAQYFIEDVDIDSESHNVDEAEVLTVVEVHAQPSFIADTLAYNATRRNDSIIAAPDAVIQRFGVRWQKKSVPILSGSDAVANKTGDPKLKNTARDAGRDGYARAWMNRRNAKLRSATVTINGTPEIRLCNTVAFVGNLKGILKTTATNQIAASVVGTLGSAASNLLSQGGNPGAVAALSTILVYYVTAIAHNYTQGVGYTTTLTLTHGRHWTDPLPQGSVGFSLDATDTDGIVGQMKAAFGQSLTGADADAFAAQVNNKLQFIASGDVSFLTPIGTDQFGFTARTPKASLLSKFRSSLASEIQGALDIQRQYCTVLHKFTDPKSLKKKADDKAKTKSKTFDQRLSDAWNSITNGISSLETQAAKAINKLFDQAAKKISDAEKQAIAKAQDAINQAELKALNALMGGKEVKIFNKLVIDPDTTIPAVALAPFKTLGVDTSKITSFPFGVALYTYISHSTIDDGGADARKKAETFIQLQAKSDLNPKNSGQLKILQSDILTTNEVDGIVITPGAKPQINIFVTGFMIVAVTPNC